MNDFILMHTTEENRIIQLTEIVRNVKYYALTDEAISVISEKIKINGTSYSEAILDTISMLKNSTSSQKDRRIGKMLSNALRRGVITKEIILRLVN